MIFCEQCAAYVAEKTNSEKCTSSAIRNKVIKYLSTKCQSIEEAEDFFHVEYNSGNVSSTGLRSSTPKSFSTILNDCTINFELLLPEVKHQLLETFFLKYVKEVNDDKKWLNKFRDDSLGAYVCAVQNLHSKGKDNLICHASKCFSNRDNGQQTRLPIGQMPYGLKDYTLKSFSIKRTNNLKCEDDYLEWQTSIMQILEQNG